MFSLLEGSFDPTLIQEIESDIALVEAELARQVRSQVRLVASVGSHVLQAGGKRLRPAFVALSARACRSNFEADRVYRLAACMEMIHMATLIHDDVIDHAGQRRGRETANVLFGNTPSILSGDVLLSKAMSILAMDGDIEIIRTVSSAVVELAEGEVRELETRNRFELEEEEHFEILRMKTASFIQCCCEVGARVAGADEAMRDALGAYGHHIGLAFQIVDDLLDYSGDRARTGKPRATDFREGCSTLPLIYLLPTLSSDERAQTQAKFGNGASDDDIEMLCRLMDDRGAFHRAEESARLHADKAKRSLDALHGSGKELLQAAADFVINRRS